MKRPSPIESHVGEPWSEEPVEQIEGGRRLNRCLCTSKRDSKVRVHEVHGSTGADSLILTKNLRPP